jgi:hypothetical protein
MEFLIKKGSGKDSQTTTNLQEISELLDISSIKVQLQYFKSIVEEIKRLPKIDKELVLNLIKNDVIYRGEVLNITYPASVEKNDTIPTGSIYYNLTTDKVRIKKKNGWENLI